MHDEDADGYGDDDCNDADPSVHPGAAETCDRVDQDCDGAVDEDASDARDWYADADGDGVGDGDAIRSCDQPAGTVETGGDCDDDDASVFPGAPEVCSDGVDNDCVPGGAETCRLIGDLEGSAILQSAHTPFGTGASFDPDLSGDIDGNGDGIPDLLIGMKDYDASGAFDGPGAAFYCPGPLLDLDVAADCIPVLGDDPPYGDAGRSVAGLGDVNGDGYGDFVIGDDYPHIDTELDLAATRAYVFYGPLTAASNVGEADVTYTSFVGDGLGHDAAGGPLRNGDPTVLLTAPDSGLGGVYVLDPNGSGGDITGSAGLGYVGELIGEDPGDLAGDQVMNLGDMDGDGVEEIGTSSQAHSDHAGAVYVVSSCPSGPFSLSDADAALDGAHTFGAAHDENDDGYADVVVSSTLDATVRLFLGPLSGRVDAVDGGTEQASFVEESGIWFWAYAPTGVDLDADGNWDVEFVGSDESGTPDPSALFLEYGPASGVFGFDDMALRVDLPSASYHFPSINIGDIDGDAYEDVVISGADANLYFLLGRGV